MRTTSEYNENNYTKLKNFGWKQLLIKAITVLMVLDLCYIAMSVLAVIAALITKVSIPFLVLINIMISIIVFLGCNYSVQRLKKSKINHKIILP